MDFEACVDHLRLVTAPQPTRSRLSCGVPQYTMGPPARTRIPAATYTDPCKEIPMTRNHGSHIFNLATIASATSARAVTASPPEPRRQDAAPHLIRDRKEEKHTTRTPLPTLRGQLGVVPSVEPIAQLASSRRPRRRHAGVGSPTGFKAAAQ